MFAPGELIYYGRTGICRVECIEEKNGKLYYRLKSEHDNCTIYTPVNGKVFMRPAMTKTEADALIDRIPDVKASPVHNKSIRELSSCYQAAINTHEAAELLAMIMSIYAKKQKLLLEKRRLSAVDERFMKEGETLLFGEMATALDISPKEVPEYIQKRLEEKNLHHPE